MSEIVAALADHPFIRDESFDNVYKCIHGHYTSVLPFVHYATFWGHFRRRRNFNDDRANNDTNDGNLYLLALLALACHSDPLINRAAISHVRHLGHNNPPARVYYDIVMRNLGINRSDVASWEPSSLESLQAFLIIAVLDWQLDERFNMSKIATDWLTFGMGLRKAIKLAYIPENPQPHRHPSEERFTGQIRLRTILSTFIMDRFMNHLPKESPVELGSLQLSQCLSEAEFDPDDPSLLTCYPALGDGVNSVLVWYLRIVDIFSEINWFCSQSSVTRNSSLTTMAISPPRTIISEPGQFDSNKNVPQTPPDDVDKGTSFPIFLVLQSKLEKFNERFPIQWSKELDIRADFIIQETRIIRDLCQLMLFRDHLPFLPLEHLVLGSPMGDSRSQELDTFTISAAKQTYSAARNIINAISHMYTDNLRRTSHAIPAPLAPIFSSALWQASFTALHAHHFPHLDISHSLIPADYEIGLNYGMSYNTRTQGLTGQAFYLLSLMDKQWGNAARFQRYFRWCNTFYHTWRSAALQDLLSTRKENSHFPPNDLASYIASSNFNSGYREWEDIRAPLLGFGASSFAIDQQEVRFTSPILSSFHSPGHYSPVPNFDGKSDDTDTVNAWVLLHSTIPTWTSRLSVVKNMWEKSPIRSLQYKAYREEELPQWHPLRLNYPATRMWRWDDGYSADEKLPNLEDKWRRVLEVEEDMQKKGLDLPQNIQQGTYSKARMSVMFMPPRPEVLAWDAEKKAMGVVKDTKTAPFLSWRLERPRSLDYPFVKFVPQSYLQSVHFWPHKFTGRIWTENLVDNGPETPTWNTRLFLSNMAPKPVHILSIPSSPQPTPPRQYGLPRGFMSDKGLRPPPTPANTIPMPFGEGGIRIYNGFPQTQAEILRPRTNNNRVTKNQTQSSNKYTAEILRQPNSVKKFGDISLHCNEEVQLVSGEASRSCVSTPGSAASTRSKFSRNGSGNHLRV